MTRPKLIQTVKRITNRTKEIKYANLLTVPYQQVTGYTTTDLTAIAQGTADTQRIGDSISWVDLEMRLAVFTRSTTPTPTSSNVRVMIYQWHSDDAIDPPSATVILGSSTSDPIAPVNYDLQNQQNKIKVLYDKTFLVMNTGLGPQPTEFVIPHTAGRQKISYTGGGTTGNDHVYIMVGSDTPGAAAPFVAFNARLRYRDA